MNTPHPDRYQVMLDGLDLTNYFHFTNRRNRPPLDLAYCASMIERRLGDEADMALLEANARRLDIAEAAMEAARRNPDLVVLNTTAFDRWICPYPSLENTIGLLDELRSRLPSARIAIIGPHPTVFPESSILEMKGADVAVVGEPEIPVTSIASRMLEGGDLHGIAGTVLSEDGSVELNRPTDKNKDLDRNPIPCYSIMPLDPYQPYGYFKSDLYRFAGRSTFILSSRGCPYACEFCALYVHRRGFRSRSPANVVDEIELLARDYDVGVFRFQDPEFSIERERTARICEMIIERSLKIAWSAETRYGSVDRELLELMRDSGCYQLNYGLESASQRILDSIGKRQTVEEAEEKIRATSDVGIHASNNLIFGLPGESSETLEQTLRFVRRLWKLPRVTFARASLSVPYPETVLYKRGVADGHFEEISSWSEFPQVLKASGQIGTEFRDLGEVLDGVREFNRQIGRISWSASYGEHYWANPLYYLRVGMPGAIRAIRQRIPGLGKAADGGRSAS